MRAANQFLTVMIVASGTLMSCAKKDGSEETDLSAITTVVNAASELPTCSADTMSQVYWVEETGKLVVCNGTQFVEIKGDKGEKGETGSTGNTGATGSTGSAANSGVWVYDGNNKAVGVVIDASTGIILFNNGGLAAINFLTGDYLAPIQITDGGVIKADPAAPNSCYMTDPGCAGTCYTDVHPPKNAVVRGKNSSYFIANGTETKVMGASIQSFSDPSGTCTDTGSPTPADGWPLSKVFTFPEGVSLPLTLPLSFGFKSE